MINGLTATKFVLGLSKLMHAMIYLDEEQHRRLTLDQYDTIDLMLGLLPPTLRREFMNDRASRWELPPDAIEYLDRQNLAYHDPLPLSPEGMDAMREKVLANLRERGEHE